MLLLVYWFMHYLPKLYLQRLPRDGPIYIILKPSSLTGQPGQPGEAGGCRWGLKVVL